MNGAVVGVMTTTILKRFRDTLDVKDIISSGEVKNDKVNSFLVKCFLVCW
jgi:hypothetical protein